MTNTQQTGIPISQIGLWAESAKTAEHIRSEAIVDRQNNSRKSFILIIKFLQKLQKVALLVRKPPSVNLLVVALDSQ